MSKRLIPNIIRNTIDKSIQLTFETSKYSLLWLHGAGGSAENYISFFTHSHSALYDGCRIKLLQAPSRLLTISG